MTVVLIKTLIHIFIINAHAFFESDLKLHSQCTSRIDQCMEVAYLRDKNTKIFIEKKPSLSISQDDVSEVKLGTGYLGQESLTLKFRNQVKQKIGVLTFTNPDLPLVFVFEGNIVFSAVPGRHVFDGELVMKPAYFGFGYQDSLNEIPWLKKRVDAKN